MFFENMQKIFYWDLLILYPSGIDLTVNRQNWGIYDVTPTPRDFDRFGGKNANIENNYFNYEIQLCKNIILVFKLEGKQHS